MAESATDALPRFVCFSDNTIFNSFRLVAITVLGYGMSGDVVLAQFVDTPTRVVAVKEFKFSDSRGRLRKKILFDREVIAMRTFNHPHLMKSTLAVECPNCLYLSMEYYPRGSLEKGLSQLDFDRTERYFIQLVSAVRHMHINRISHCDIKLPNILIKSNEEVILTDFGSSMAFPDGKNTLPLKAIGGTDAYICPEKRCNDRNKEIDLEKFDVYGLGVSLWGMVFRKDPEDQYYNYLEEIEKNKDIPHILSFCLKNMLEIKAEKRCNISDLMEILVSHSQWKELAGQLSM